MEEEITRVVNRLLEKLIRLPQLGRGKARVPIEFSQSLPSPLGELVLRVDTSSLTLTNTGELLVEASGWRDPRGRLRLEAEEKGEGRWKGTLESLLAKAHVRVPFQGLEAQVDTGALRVESATPLEKLVLQVDTGGAEAHVGGVRGPVELRVDTGRAMLWLGVGPGEERVIRVWSDTSRLVVNLVSPRQPVIVDRLVKRSSRVDYPGYPGHESASGGPVVVLEGVVKTSLMRIAWKGQ